MGKTHKSRVPRCAIYPSMGRPRTVCWWLGIKGLGRLELVWICGSLSGLVSRSRLISCSLVIWSFQPKYRRGIGRHECVQGLHWEPSEDARDRDIEKLFKGYGRVR